MKVAGSRLLILSCSARKRKRPGLIPAWELYDGVAFQVVKRCAREGRMPANTSILILSAMYGIITPDHPTNFYELKMTPAIAEAQRAENARRLKDATTLGAYEEIYLMLGRTYMLSLSPVGAWCGDGKVIHEPGSIGMMLLRLRNWMEGSSGFPTPVGISDARRDFRRPLYSVDENLRARARVSPRVNYPPARIKPRAVDPR